MFTIDDTSLVFVCRLADGSAELISPNLKKVQLSAEDQAKPYVLPGVPYDIKSQLHNVQKGDVPPGLRKRITEWLFYDICQNTL